MIINSHNSVKIALNEQAAGRCGHLMRLTKREKNARFVLKTTDLINIMARFIAARLPLFISRFNNPNRK